MTMTITTIAPADLITALKAAKPGDTLVCVGDFPAYRNGTWPNGVLDGITFDLTKATVTGWDFAKVANLTFIGGSLGGTLIAPGKAAGLTLTSGHNITIQGLRAPATCPDMATCWPWKALRT